MNKKVFFLIVNLLLTTVYSSIAQDQKGTVRGAIYDDLTGEALIGVSVQVKNTTFGAVTDIDGKFSINLAPGTYALQVSYISYQTISIEGLAVRAGEVTLLVNVRLKEDVQTLENVVVTAEAIRNSESAILTVKKKSPILVDGISSAKFSQIGDSDASEAVKRVTGVSVEGGKYVFVRGLGDRYTKTTLNSIDVPGLDPDRNSIQIDIFPTSLIENMMVLKSSSADMPADFTGGVVNIETKDFPEEKIFNVSVGIGYNPSMHFNSNYFTYKGGKTDWLGFDDGIRALPDGARSTPFPAVGVGATDESIGRFVRNFSKVTSTQNQTNLMDYDFSLSAGNQKNYKNGSSLGYIFSATYKNATVLYDDAFIGEYQRPLDPSEYELVYATTQNGQQAERNVLIGAQTGIAYKTKLSKFKLSVLHLQNGESKSSRFFIDDNGSAVGKSGYTGASENMEYNQRAVTNLLLAGDHRLGDNSLKIEWKISPTFSNIQDPDIRKVAFSYTSSDTVFAAGQAGFPSRIWRNLNEINIGFRIDIEKTYSLFRKPALLKFGGSHVAKERDFEILQYNMQFSGLVPQFNGNSAIIMNDEFLYPSGSVYYASGNTTPNSNAYNATSTNTALYLSNQFQIHAKLKAIVGLRAEKFLQRHTGRDAIYGGGNTTDGRNLDNAKVLDALDLFPSGNFIFSYKDDQNLRFSYSRTIARPSFKELSFAQILDPVSNRIFNGGLFATNDWDGNLRETYIDNFDLRWEKYLKKSELFSVGAFYKSFDDPIELIQMQAAQTNPEFQPRNVGDGRVFGVELELRKSFDFISPSLQYFFVAGNVTFVDSKIEMNNQEFNARQAFEKVGQTEDNIRPMAGQAPYIINFGLSYENTTAGIDGGLFYNVNGPTLTVVGGGIFPDVYSEPFNSLNFNVNKKLGNKKKFTLNLSVNNILNDLKESFYTGFRAQDQLFNRLNPGRSFGAGLKYSIH
jgi:outer membrane receptor protein involved in Fe transport